jgi:hypothetical protein
MALYPNFGVCFVCTQLPCDRSPSAGTHIKGKRMIRGSVAAPQITGISVEPITLFFHPVQFLLYFSLPLAMKLAAD